MAFAEALSCIYANPTAHSVPKLNPSRRLWRPYRHMKITLSSSSFNWASIDADIDAYLRHAMPIKQPLSVHKPLHHFTFGAPPNAAPALCIAACQLIGGRCDRAVLAAASTLRLVHAASNAHERLLSTSGSKPMINQPYGPNINLLIGDGMLPLGMGLLAQADDPAQQNSDRILRVIIELTRGIGSQGVIDGRHYELAWRNRSDHMEWVRGTAEKIEGRFYACAAACGAILGGGNEVEIEKLRNFGFYVGKIYGILNRNDGKENGIIMKEVEEIKGLAMKELRDFKREKVETIMLNLFEANLNCVQGNRC